MSKHKAKETELIDIGKKLGKSHSKDGVVKLLLQASRLLAELDQSPPQSIQNAMEGCSEALVSPALLRHKDKEVGLLVAICISEIMRIVAPDAPYSDETLKEIFQLIVTNFKGLDDVNSPSFARRVNILETVAKVRSCVVMLDLECDDLILEMFETFFQTASDEQPHNVFVAMRNVLTLVLEESEKIPTAMVEVILRNLLKQKKEGSAARKLAVAVVEKCADKLEPYVRSLLTSVMVEGKSLDSELHNDHREIIYELYGCAPQLLSNVIPHISADLGKGKVNVRLMAVTILGRLFAHPRRQFAHDYPLVLSEFVKRYSDKAVEVREAVINCTQSCLEANPSSEQASEILGALQDRLLDFDDKVRVAVVKAIYDLAISDPKSVPSSLLCKVAERLRDKKVVVRQATLLKTMELYKSYCTNCFEGSSSLDKEYEWIPGKIARCCNDDEIRGLEIILTEQLFPASIPVEQQAKHWVLAFSTFDENEKKALEFILLQKQRLQQEMQAYLTTRLKAKEEEIPSLEGKLQSIFKVIAIYFVDAPKAEESLQELHQMKDESVFTALSTLLNPNTTVSQAASVREELLKKVGTDHAQYEFMKSLATKCGYFFFSREHVYSIAEAVLVYKVSENEKDLVAASLSLLVEIAIYCPELMADAEEQLLTLLKDPDESIKEGVVHVISKCGASFRNKGSATESRSNVNLILEQLCLEGSRKQAKYAVSAIAAMTADSGLLALSVLYGRLVDKLEDDTHIFTVLQSLGCIAQNAMPIFETREDDIIKFVVRNVLRRPSLQEVESVPVSDSPSTNVLLKTCALKVLVKSFLPKMNAHQRTRLPGLLKVLVKILACGEIYEQVKTSDSDRAHLRLAAAKGVLRLARRWDSQIPVDVFHMVVMTVQDQAAHVRHALLRKIHQYLKDRTLNLKYASAYALCAADTVKEIAVEARRFMTNFVDDYRREAYKAAGGQSERATITLHPEYALVYLVHVLAHHPNFPVASGGVQPDPTAYEPFYRELLFFLRALNHHDAEGKHEGVKHRDNLPLILAILRTIKGCENAVDHSKTETLYAVCDIAIMITKDIAHQKKKRVETYPGVIPLPASVYKVAEPKAPEVNAPPATNGDPKASEVPVSEAPKEPSEPKGAEVNAAEVSAPDSNDTEGGEPNETKTVEADEPKTAEAADSKVGEAADLEAAEAADLKADEVTGLKTAEATDLTATEVTDLKVTEVIDLKGAEVIDLKAAEVIDLKIAEVNGSLAVEAIEQKTAETTKPKDGELNEIKAAEGVVPTAPDLDESITLKLNESRAPESDIPTPAEPEKFVAPRAVESKGAEPHDTPSKTPESGGAAAVVEQVENTEDKKAVEEPAKVDGSHLPPCFTDKDVLAKFKIGMSAIFGQPASPRVRKRGKRVDNGDVPSEKEAEVEHSEPTPKKGKVEKEKPAKAAGSTGTGVIIKGPSRGGRKSVDKSESAKRVATELEKEPEEELDENTPNLRRGRRKDSGKKDEAGSGEEMAVDTTPTVSAKKGKPASSEPQSLTESGKKRGRPSKLKSEEEEKEKSSQKKKVSTPEKSGKRGTPGEKVSPAWKEEGERGGDESLVGCGIKVWWPLDNKFYKGEVVEYDAKKKKHKILYNDGEQEILNLAKERWELFGKQTKTPVKKEKTPTATPPTPLSGTKYPEPKRLKVTSKTPPSHQGESGKTPTTSKEAKSAKSAKSASTPKATKEAKSPKVSKSKEKVVNAFEFDEDEAEPETKKRKSTPKGGRQGKAEKAMSTSKDSVSESAKVISEEKPEEGKGVGNTEDDEPLDNWRTRSTKKSKPVSN